MSSLEGPMPEPAPEPEGDTYEDGASAGAVLGVLREQDVEHTEEIVGRGASGIVRKGRLTLPNSSQVWVAIKALAPGATKGEVQMFQKEFKIALQASQKCPGACTMYGCIIREDALCLVMKLYADSMNHFLDKHRDPHDDTKRLPLCQEDAIKWASQIAEALVQLHRENIVVQDLKPGNLLMDEDGSLFIADYGLADIADRTILSRSTMATGGTPAYMAPEQYDSQIGISDKTDIWAFGCVVVEMLTGVVPWSGKKSQEIMMALLVKKQVPDIPQGLPTELETLLRDCLSLEPAHRPTAANVTAALKPLLQHIAAESQRRADEDAAAAATAAFSGGGATGAGVDPSILKHLHDRIAALERLSSTAVAAPTIDPQLKRAMEQRGLTSTQQAALVRDGLMYVSQLQDLQDQDFRLLGIHLPRTSTQRAGHPQGTAQPTSQTEKDQLRNLLEREGEKISAAGRATLMSFVGSLTQLCQLSLQTMQVIGLNITDRRYLANLTLDGPTTLKNILVLQKSALTERMTLDGIRMLSSKHQCNDVMDVLQLDIGDASQFTDRKDREVVGSLILSGGHTPRLSAVGQQALQKAGHRDSSDLLALDSGALATLIGLPPADASLVFTRGQSHKISRKGLAFLDAGGKKTLHEVYPLKTANAQDFGMSQDDAYVINELVKPENRAPVTWQLPSAPVASDSVPAVPLAGFNVTNDQSVEVWPCSLAGDPAMRMEMEKRGFSGREQSCLVAEGINTVAQLRGLADVDFTVLKIMVTGGYNNLKHTAMTQLQNARKVEPCTDEIAARVRDALATRSAIASAEAQDFANLAKVMADPQPVSFDDIAVCCNKNTATRLTLLYQALPALEKDYNSSDAEKQELSAELDQCAGYVSPASKAMLVEFVGSVKNIHRLSAPTPNHRGAVRKLGLTFAEQLAASECAVAFLRPRDVEESFSRDLQQKHSITQPGADAIARSGRTGVSDLLVLKTDPSIVMALGLSADDVTKVSQVQLTFTETNGLTISGNTASGQRVVGDGQWRAAACGNNVMYTGRHYVEFRHAGGSSSPSGLHYGVVDESFNARGGTPAHQNAAGGTWMLQHQTGQLRVGNATIAWSGSDQVQGAPGSTLGLLLDLYDGSLSVYKGGTFLGFAVPPNSLVGPLRWCADCQCYTTAANVSTHGVIAQITAKPTP